MTHESALHRAVERFLSTFRVRRLLRQFPISREDAAQELCVRLLEYYRTNEIRKLDAYVNHCGMRRLLRYIDREARYFRRHEQREIR